VSGFEGQHTPSSHSDTSGIGRSGGPPARRSKSSTKPGSRHQIRAGSEVKLAWSLADTVAACFTDAEHAWTYAALGAGEASATIRRVLDIVVRHRFPLPTKLIRAVESWLECYAGTDNESQLRDLIRRLVPQAVTSRTTSDPRSPGHVVACHNREGEHSGINGGWMPDAAKLPFPRRTRRDGV
jgi:hypothetical protein